MGHARRWVRSLPNNTVWHAALARTLSLSSYALTAARRAHDAEADAQRARSGAFAPSIPSPALRVSPSSAC